MITRNNAWGSPGRDGSDDKRGGSAYEIDTVGRLRHAEAAVEDPHGPEGRRELEEAAERAAERFAAKEKRGSAKRSMGTAGDYKPVDIERSALPNTVVEDYVHDAWALPGAPAEIAGLQNAAYLNGTVGTLERLDGDRWVVRLPTGDERKIRPANLRPAPMQRATDATRPGLGPPQPTPPTKYW